MASAISIKGLTRHFPDSEKPAVDQVDLEVAAGEIVSLVGPSGCGKSTTLRLIAGLDVPDAGSIRIGERDVAKVPPQERDVAMVFQGFALYPHMKVRDIMAFPLKMRKVPAAERDKSVAETAELLGILWIGGFGSAIVDNIPFTTAMIPVVDGLVPAGGDNAYWWALSLGACFGGNATIIAAAANVAASGLAERAGQPIGFTRFLKFGLPATLISLLLATAWVLVVYVLL